MKTSTFLLVAALCATVFAEDYTVLSDWLHYSDVENSLYHYWANEAFDLLDERKAEIQQLDSQAAWLQRQQTVRETLLNIVGPFPEKSPLNARITGTVERDEFVVEKILFESQPQFYVTGCLFLPNARQTPAPAVIYCSGHTELGFRSPTYQTVILNLVKKGFIVFAFDPVGQGERLQYVDPETGTSRVGGATKEHSFPGAQCFLIGSSAARHMTWDGIRAVDFLLTRPEIDPQRIGITGRSGGGTQSSYIAALDERIYAAAPECYITNFKRLLQSIGPQDAEQNFLGGIAHGIDHADLLQMRAPKPVLHITTSRDFFSIQGARETFAEVQRAYSYFDAAEHISFATDDSTHASTQKNREALYAFFQTHLQVPGNSEEVAVTPFEYEELLVTDRGQVVLSMPAETMFSLNRTKAKELLETMAHSRQQPERHITNVRQRVAQCCEISNSAASALYTGGFDHSTYRVDKYILQLHSPLAIPFLVFTPTHFDSSNIVFYLHPEGKSSDMPTILNYVEQGNAVVAMDVPGLGECGPGELTGDAYKFPQGTGAYNLWFLGMQVEQSLVAVRVHSVLQVMSHVTAQWSDPPQITMHGVSTLCPIVQHAAVLQPTITRIILDSPLLTWESLVNNEYYNPEFIHGTIPGALAFYDLPDLCAAIAPRELHINHPVDAMGEPLAIEQADEVVRFIRSSYDRYDAANRLVISASRASLE